MHLRQTNVRRGAARHRRSWFASFPLFFCDDWLTVLREGLLVTLRSRIFHNRIVPHPGVAAETVSWTCWPRLALQMMHCDWLYL